MTIWNVKRLIEMLPLLGVKGTTGTQASFVELFDGDMEKVKKLDEMVVLNLGFKKQSRFPDKPIPEK